MKPFEIRPMPRLIFGDGSVERVGSVAVEMGCRVALLVTDPGIVAAGHTEFVEKSLQEAGIEVTVFSGVVENPTTREVYQCVEAARSANVDTVIGLGGGSSIDTAKGCNFIHTNGGRVQDYRGFGKAQKEMLPFMAIPTTAGTGSECQSYALISDVDTHEKMACGDTKAMATIAILDPALTYTQPRSVTASSGIDALAHSLETAVTRTRNEFSSQFSLQAFRMIESNLEKVLNNSNDREARGAMLLGAAYSGFAIENSMLGCAHSTANPLTARFGLTHGHAVGLMLPHAMRFNAKDPSTLSIYVRYAISAGLASDRDDLADAGKHLIDRVSNLMKLTGLSVSLSECQVDRDSIPELAVEASRQWTAGFNPRPVSEDDFVHLYEAAWE